jgi:hypothetical protein
MGYVIAGALVLFIVGTGIAVFWIAARDRRGGPAAVDDRSPLGDTSEHAGEHRDGRTVREPGAQPPADAA